MTAGRQGPGGKDEKARGGSLKTRVKTARKRSLSSTLWLAAVVIVGVLSLRLPTSTVMVLVDVFVPSLTCTSTT